MSLFDDEEDEEDIYDAVIALRKAKPYCEVCGNYVRIATETCDSPKNGYCVLFRAQAENDKVTFNMAKRVN